MCVSPTPADGAGRVAAHLFTRAQAGCRDSLDRLMAEHDGLVHAVVRGQFRGALSFADALQAGRIGLWQAIVRYDPAHGHAFSTYAWPCIAHQVWRAVRQASQDDQRWQLEQEASARLPTPGLQADPVTMAESTAIAAALADLVARLPTPLHDIVALHHGLDGQTPASFRTIATRTGLSHQRIHQLHGEALIWLRQPAHAYRLWSLLDRHTVADYERTQAATQAWLQRRRQRHGR